MKSDLIIVGGGASGLMAAYQAARAFGDAGRPASVIILEKMPRVARKLMITGKGRCNFTNVKSWNEFSSHVRAGARFLRPAFYTLPPEQLVSFFAVNGMRSVVERGDRAYPASYLASDVVDTLRRVCLGAGVKIQTGAEVREVLQRCPSDKSPEYRFSVATADGETHMCRSLIIATGGLSYPTTGSTGDGYAWAKTLGHSIVPTFPSLTALVPKAYKANESKGLHIDRETPLTALGRVLCGVEFKDARVELIIDGNVAQSESGEVYFTDGGIEGPVGFQISRKAVKAMINGAHVSLVVSVSPGKITDILSPKLKALHVSVEEAGRKEVKWTFEIAGYVGYERAVVTAGGVDTDEVLPKTLESRLCPGLYLCGEVLDLDADTGGYNLQIAFCTGALAGQSAAKGLL